MLCVCDSRASSNWWFVSPVRWSMGHHLRLWLITSWHLTECNQLRRWGLGIKIVSMWKGSIVLWSQTISGCRHLLNGGWTSKGAFSHNLTFCHELISTLVEIKQHLFPYSTYFLMIVWHQTIFKQDFTLNLKAIFKLEVQLPVYLVERTAFTACTLLVIFSF